MGEEDEGQLTPPPQFAAPFFCHRSTGAPGVVQNGPAHLPMGSPTLDRSSSPQVPRPPSPGRPPLRSQWPTLPSRNRSPRYTEPPAQGPTTATRHCLSYIVPGTHP